MVKVKEDKDWKIKILKKEVDRLEYKLTKIDKLIIQEITTAQKEGTPTSRLTSLYNKIFKLK